MIIKGCTLKKIVLVGFEKAFCFMIKVICQFRCGHYSKIHINNLLARIVCWFTKIKSIIDDLIMFISKV